MENPILKEPDEQIIATLTKRVSVLSESQTAELLGQPECKLEETLLRLVREKVIERFEILARPEIALRRPVSSWSPGVCQPDSGPVAYPNGDTFAWPVYDAEDMVEPLGNLKLTIQEIWGKYRFKKNHLHKYLGKSIRTHKTS